MSLVDPQFEIPTLVAGLVVALFGASIIYGIVVMQSLAAPIMAWLGILGIGLSLFVVYLLCRFVLAVEKVAEKI